MPKDYGISYGNENPLENQGEKLLKQILSLYISILKIVSSLDPIKQNTSVYRTFSKKAPVSVHNVFFLL